MVVTVLDLKEKYKEYIDINGKFKRDVENNILFPVEEVYMKQAVTQVVTCLHHSYMVHHIYLLNTHYHFII